LWDGRKLGADTKHARRVPDEVQRQVDEALGSGLISIRMPVRLIEALKLLADIEGVGYST
jgi:hypothetical protein